METLIKSQRETITELEAKIQAKLEELKKVSYNRMRIYTYISNKEYIMLLLKTRTRV